MGGIEGRNWTANSVDIDGPMSSAEASGSGSGPVDVRPPAGGGPLLLRLTATRGGGVGGLFDFRPVKAYVEIIGGVLAFIRALRVLDARLPRLALRRFRSGGGAVPTRAPTANGPGRTGCGGSGWRSMYVAAAG